MLVHMDPYLFYEWVPLAQDPEPGAWDPIDSLLALYRLLIVFAIWAMDMADSSTAHGAPERPPDGVRGGTNLSTTSGLATNTVAPTRPGVQIP